MEKDIADYAKDGRLTKPSDGKRYEWRKMIDAAKVRGFRNGLEFCLFACKICNFFRPTN